MRGDNVVFLFFMFVWALLIIYLYYRMVRERNSDSEVMSRWQVHQDESNREDVSQEDRVEINSASQSTLAAIPEIGPLRARKIRQHIENVGNINSFRELDEILNLNDFYRNRLRDRFVFADGERDGHGVKKLKGRIIDY